MNLIAFDTSTETMSIAVSRHSVKGVNDVFSFSGAGGAQSSTRLLPTIASLMSQAGLKFSDLDAVVFGRGPGSFTGVRTACAVAQGLGFAAAIPLLGVDTLLALAQQARELHPHCSRITALLDARMDEVYIAHYDFDDVLSLQTATCHLMTPEQVTARPGFVMAGNVFASYGTRLANSSLLRIEALPTATALLNLAPPMIAAGQTVDAADALPLYVRDKVAKTTAERLSEQILASSRSQA